MMINCKMGGYKLVLDTTTGLITGKGTYECKDVLKSKWKCTYNAISKGWVLKNADDIKMFIDMHQDKNEIPVVVVTATTVASISKSSYYDGLCPKCGSYCYGDCSAH